MPTDERPVPIKTLGLAEARGIEIHLIAGVRVVPLDEDAPGMVRSGNFAPPDMTRGAGAFLWDTGCNCFPCDDSQSIPDPLHDASRLRHTRLH